MSKGPKGEKRPADVIGNAVRVMRIAMGEMTTPLDPFAHAGAVLGYVIAVPSPCRGFFNKPLPPVTIETEALPESCYATAPA